MKKLIRLLSVGVILGSMVVPLLAPMMSALAQWQGTLTVANNSSTSYPMFPAIVSANITYLINNHYMSSSGNDTLVQVSSVNQPFMLSTDKITFASPLPNNSNIQGIFLTEQTPQASPFSIVIGYGGYVTTNDTAALELGSNFTLPISGYFDTSVSGNISSKLGAYQLTTGSGNITLSVGATTNITQATLNGARYLYTGSNSRFGERFNSFPVSTINSVSLVIGKVLVPTGTANVTVRRVSDDAIIGTLGTVNVATLGAGSPMTFSNPVANPTLQDIRIQIEYVGGDVNNKLEIDIWGGDVYAGGTETSYLAGYTDTAGEDTYFDVSISPLAITSVAVPSFAGLATTTSDGTNLWITANSVSSTNITTVSIPDTANPIIWGSNNSMPYTTSIKMVIGGTEKLWYQPNTIIQGTVLPDRDSTKNGDITWGSNPTGVTTSISNFVPQTIAIAATQVISQDVAPPISRPGVSLNPATEPNPSNPLSLLVSLLAGSYMYDVPPMIIWIVGAFILSIIAFAISLSLIKHLGLSMVAGSLVWGIATIITPIPNAFLWISVLGLIVGIVQESR